MASASCFHLSAPISTPSKQLQQRFTCLKQRSSIQQQIERHCSSIVLAPRSSRRRMNISAVATTETEEESASTELPTTHKAWVYKGYGAPKDVLQLEDIALPPMKPDQVLVQVRAAALNPVDFKRLSGKYKDTDSDFPTVPGYDFCGVVMEVGSECTKYKVGDQVYGNINEQPLQPKQWGTLAEFTVVEEKLIAPKPKIVNFPEAASLPLALLTAYQGLEKANMKEGKSVLVLGGAGGVGTLAFQLAKNVYKASVVAITTTAKKENYLKQLKLSPDKVIDYTKENYAELPEKYDVVFDCVGDPNAVKAVKEGGVAVVLTGDTSPPGIKFTVTSCGETLEKLTEYIESKAVKPVLDNKGQFLMKTVPDAFEYIGQGHAFGKVVISAITIQWT